MSTDGLRVDEKIGGVRFAVRVQPRASRSGIAGIHGDALKVRLTAAPVDGAANSALIELLADLLAVSRSAVRVVTGERARNKVVEVVGIEPSRVRRLVTNEARR